MDQVVIKNTLIATVLILWGALEVVWWWRGRKGQAEPNSAGRIRNIFTFALVAVAVWWITTHGFSPG